MGDHYTSLGVPLSGPFGTEVTSIHGDICTDTINGKVYVNEGLESSPYWTLQPTHYSSDVHLNVGDTVPVAGSTASVLLPGGVRVFGAFATENDSGLEIEAVAKKNIMKQMRTTDSTGSTLCLGQAVPLNIAQYPIVIDVTFTNNTAITNRSLFLGFVGEASDAMLEPCAGSGTTITFNPSGTAGDDVAGMFLDTGLTDDEGIFFPSTTGNAAASVETDANIFDMAVDLDRTIPAHETDTQWRVQIDGLGTVSVFIDKELVGYREAAFLHDEINPVFCLGSNANAIQKVDVTNFAIWHG